MFQECRGGSEGAEEAGAASVPGKMHVRSCWNLAPIRGAVREEMGSMLSKEEAAVVKLLQHILSQRGLSYDEGSLRKLLSWARQRGLIPSVSAAFALTTWDKISAALWEDISSGSEESGKFSTMWRLILETLKEMKVVSRRLYDAATEGDSKTGIHLAPWWQILTTLHQVWTNSTNGAKPEEAVNSTDSETLLNTPSMMAIPSTPPLPPELLSLIAATLTTQDQAREQDNLDNDAIDTDKPFDPGPIDLDKELTPPPPPPPTPHLSCDCTFGEGEKGV